MPSDHKTNESVNSIRRQEAEVELVALSNNMLGKLYELGDVVGEDIVLSLAGE